MQNPSTPAPQSAFAKWLGRALGGCLLLGALATFWWSHDVKLEAENDVAAPDNAASAPTPVSPKPLTPVPNRSENKQFNF